MPAGEKRGCWREGGGPRIPAAGQGFSLSVLISVYVHKQQGWAKVLFLQLKGTCGRAGGMERDNSLRNERIQCQMG